MISILSSLIMLFGLIDLYRTNYVIATSFVIIALHQMFSKKLPTREKKSGNDEHELVKDEAKDSDTIETKAVGDHEKKEESSHESEEEKGEVANKSKFVAKVSDDNENPEVDIDVNVYDEGEPRNDHADFEEETRKEGNE